MRRPAHARSGPAIRVPIALKFSAFNASLIVLFMSWQTWVARATAARELEQEINRAGVTLAASLASLIDPVEMQKPEGREALIRSLSAFSSGPGGARILNVVVEDSKGPIATARAESRFRRSEGTIVDDAAARAAGVEVREFRYEGAPVRSFSQALALPSRVEPAEPVAPEPPSAGRVEVYVSASAIAEARRRLSNAMIQVGFTACAVAVIGALVLARILTAPIRALGRDMKQVSLGDLEHKSAVATTDEIGDLARTFNQMTVGLKAAQEARIAQEAVEHELALAARIQARLLPSGVPAPAGFEVAVHYTAAREVSGDYYDFIGVDEDRTGFVVADVSGKGVPAALVMSMTRSLLRMAVSREPAPDAALVLLHRSLVPDLERGMFVTMAYFVLSSSSRSLSLVRAGHNAPLLYTARDRKVHRVQPRGMGIGLDRKGSLFRSELQVQRLQMSPGDLLVVYTDGVVEAKDQGGADFSEARLIETVLAAASGPAGEVIRSVASAVSEHRRGAEPSDDVTILALKCNE